MKPGTGGEIQLADAINVQANSGTRHCDPEGERFDCGSVSGFVEATNFEFKKMKFSKKKYEDRQDPKVELN